MAFPRLSKTSFPGILLFPNPGVSLKERDWTRHPLRTFALIVFVHPHCARKFMLQWCHVMHRARARRRCGGKYSTFGQNDNFARVLRFKEVSDPHFFLDTSPSLTNACRLSKNGQKINGGSLFFFSFLYPRAIEFRTL